MARILIGQQAERMTPYLADTIQQMLGRHVTAGLGTPTLSTLEIYHCDSLAQVCTITYKYHRRKGGNIDIDMQAIDPRISNNNKQ
eukprot:scaffold7189_cov142-Skeletonema_menzelii.AAC.3